MGLVWGLLIGDRVLRRPRALSEDRSPGVPTGLSRQVQRPERRDAVAGRRVGGEEARKAAGRPARQRVHDAQVRGGRPGRVVDGTSAAPRSSVRSAPMRPWGVPV